LDKSGSGSAIASANGQDDYIPDFSLAAGQENSCDCIGQFKELMLSPLLKTCGHRINEDSIAIIGFKSQPFDPAEQGLHLDGNPYRDGDILNCGRGILSRSSVWLENVQDECDQTHVTSGRGKTLV